MGIDFLLIREVDLTEETKEDQRGFGTSVLGQDTPGWACQFSVSKGDSFGPVDTINADHAELISPVCHEKVIEISVGDGNNPFSSTSG